MENNQDHNGDATPQSQLVMLNRVQDAAEVEAWMPPTPIWHAPLLATVIAGATLVGSGPSFGLSIAGLVLGVAAFGISAVDQVRRQRAWPRRLRRPLRVLLFYALMIVVTLSIVGWWGMVNWPSGLGSQLAVVGGMWIATSAVFALGIASLNRLRDHWAASPR